MSYGKRQLSKIIEEICNEEGLKFESFSDDWIIQITTNDNKKALIYGYKFPNNGAAISKVCDDKAGLSSILESNSIPHIKHHYFENPKSPMNDDNGLFNNLFKLFQENGILVVKSNLGSGGRRVYKCETIKELEIAVFDLFKSYRSMTISPYIEIENEYRVIVENGKVMLIYSKQRPSVIGDGISTIETLIKNNNLEGIDISNNINLSSIPNKDEIVTISWKHNLSQGSLPVMIENNELIKKLSKFALDTSHILNLNFASVDIIKEVNGTYKILEINSGVMMENYSMLSEENYNIAKHIYKSAIYNYFNMQLHDNIKTIYESISQDVLKTNELH